MSKTFHKEPEFADGEYGNYFLAHQNKDSRRAKRFAELAKKKRRFDDDEDYDT